MHTIQIERDRVIKRKRERESGKRVYRDYYAIQQVGIGTTQTT